MSGQDDAQELQDMTARLIHGSHDLIGRLDERDRLRIDWPVSGKTIYMDSLRCEVCDEYVAWCGHTTDEHRRWDNE